MLSRFLWTLCILSTEFILPSSFLLFLLIRYPVICKFLQFQHYATITLLLQHLLCFLKPQINEQTKTINLCCKQIEIRFSPAVTKPSMLFVMPYTYILLNAYRVSQSIKNLFCISGVELGCHFLLIIYPYFSISTPRWKGKKILFF